jgi:hypothetical protein
VELTSTDDTITFPSHGRRVAATKKPQIRNEKNLLLPAFLSVEASQHFTLLRQAKVIDAV